METNHFARLRNWGRSIQYNKTPRTKLNLSFVENLRTNNKKYGGGQFFIATFRSDKAVLYVSAYLYILDTVLPFTARSRLLYSELLPYCHPLSYGYRHDAGTVDSD